MNSDFSFSKTSCLTKAEEPSLSYYFTHSWRENNWIHTFPKCISAMWNATSLIQHLNSCRHVHFLRRQPPLHHGNLHYIYICILLHADRQGGLVSVTVFMVGNGTRDQRSNPGRGCLHITSSSCSLKRHEFTCYSSQLWVKSRVVWMMIIIALSSQMIGVLCMS